MNFFCIISSIISSSFTGCGVGTCVGGGLWQGYVTRAVGILQGKGWGHVVEMGHVTGSGGMWQGLGLGIQHI